MATRTYGNHGLASNTALEILPMMPDGRQHETQPIVVEGDSEVPLSGNEGVVPRRWLSWRVLTPFFLVALGGVAVVHWYFSWGLFHTEPRPPLTWTPASLADEESLKHEILYAADRLTEVYPKHPDAWHSKALINQRFGSREVAIACWRRCLKLDSQYALAYYSLGVDAVAQGDRAAGIKSLRKAIEIDPQMDTAYLDLAQVLTEERMFTDALESLKTFVGRVPQSAEGHFRLGEAYLDVGQAEEARYQYLQCLEITPGYAPVYEGLAAASAKLGQNDEEKRYRSKFETLQEKRREAEETLSKEVDERTALQFGIAAAHANVGKVYLVYGRPQDAERHWLRATDVCPSDTTCRQMLVEAYVSQGRTEEALAVVRKLAEIQPQNLSHWNNIGALSFQLRQYDSAELAYRKVIELAPQSYLGYAALAEVLLKAEHNGNEAYQLAEKAVQLAPIADHYYLLGVAKARSGSREEALEAFRRATELDSANPEYREALDQLQADKPPTDPQKEQSALP